MSPMTREEIVKELDDIFDEEEFDGEQIVLAIQEWVAETEAARKLEALAPAIADKVRKRAVEAGCRERDVAEANIPDVCDLADWDDDDAADIVVECLAECALEFALVDCLLATIRAEAGVATPVV